MKYTLSCIGSILLSVSTLFGTSYLFKEVLPNNHWVNLPLFIVCSIIVFSTLVLVVNCLTDTYNLKRN